MGANAQTSVPAFTAGQVLTAAQMTQVNTGIPVFASSTQRDAAFGGSGEKTLAEGQTAYLEDTNETQYYDGASWLPLGAIAGIGSNVVYASTDTSTSTSSTSYVDTALSATITPTSATSKILLMTSNQYLKGPNSITRVSLSLFRGNAATGTDLSTETYGFAQVYTPQDVYKEINTAFMCVDSPATTSAQTYTVAIKTNQSSVTVGGMQSLILIEVAG